jgi:3-isopropylmalate/(R)-2-methylmalate dehydratase small subunit
MLKGYAHLFGDNVDTDAIIPARYCTSFHEELGLHLFEGEDPDFVKRLKKGDIIVAGSNFGCGSAREHAPVAIKSAGISAVIASSFSRTFFRNAINIALPVLELTQTNEIREDDLIEIDTDQNVIRNLTKLTEYKAAPYPDYIKQVIDAGGIIEFARRRLTEKKST